MPYSASPAADREWDIVAGLVDKDPSGNDVNTGHEICSRYAGHPGTALTVVHPDGSRDRWSYAELDRHAARLARVFSDNGLQRGDRVAALLSRQVETWIVAVAAWRSGLVVVPLFGGFGADAIGLRLAAAQVQAVVSDVAYLDALDDAVDRFGLDPLVLATGRHRPAAPVGRPWLWDAIEAVAADGPIRTTAVGDLATVLFTSGTTGTPKGCAMPHGALLSVLPYVRHVMGTGGRPVFSTADPGWAYGLYTTGAAVLALRQPLVVYSGTSFVPDDWHRVAAEEKAAVLATAPSAIRRLTSTFRARGVPSGLRNVVVAGEPLTPSIVEDWSELAAPPVRNGYGLSEIGMVLADTLAHPAGGRPGTLASTVPGFDAFLATRDGRPAPAGEPGLVAIRRPRFPMSTGYVNAAELWSSRWLDGVYLTEDRAVRDEAGGVWTVIGRDDDIMVIAGHNISPVEIESAVLGLPEISDAAAVSHTDGTRGAVVRVVAVADESAVGPALVERVKKAVATSVGKYAAPKVVDFVSALPRTEVGKLRRAALRTDVPAG